MAKGDILEDGSVEGETFSGPNYKGGYPHHKQGESSCDYRERVRKLRKQGFHLGDLSWSDYQVYCDGSGY